MNQHQRNSQKGGWVRSGRLSARRRRAIAKLAAAIRWAKARLVRDFGFTATDFERWGVNAFEGQDRLDLLHEAYHLSQKDAKRAVRG